MKVGLVPVLDIPKPADAWDRVGPTPPLPRWEHLSEWDSYLAKALLEGGYAAYKTVSEGIPFYRATDISVPDLRTIIDLHLEPLRKSDGTITDSCPLFGGLALVLDDKLALVPQCCGTLDDATSWQSVVAPGFEQGFICPEGHPQPKVVRRGKGLEVRCEDEWEEFNLPAPSSVTVPLEALRDAVERAIRELTTFAATVDTLSAEYEVERLSRHLVWGETQ